MEIYKDKIVLCQTKLENGRKFQRKKLLVNMGKRYKWWILNYPMER